MTQYLKFFKKYTLPLSVIILLLITGCSSTDDTSKNNDPSVSNKIVLDQSLDNAIDASLQNYQAVVIVFYRGYF